MKKLDSGQIHILKLIHRDKQPDGWTIISEPLYNVIKENIPKELAIFEPAGIFDPAGGGKAKLTPIGQNVLDSIPWLL